MSNLITIIDMIISPSDSGFAYMPDYVMEESRPKTMGRRLAHLRIGGDYISGHFSMFRM